MKLYHKLIVLLIPVIALFTAVNAIDIVVNVKWQWLTIWTPANISLGSFSNSTTVTLTDNLWIEDLRWNKTGHYTTIQWVVYWWNGEIVSGAIVEFKTNSSIIALLWGVEDNADFNRNLVSFTDITNPKLLFYRNDNQNHSWYLNKYWFKPSIKITVPSGLTGPYTVKLSYTLYDMSTDIITQ